MAQSPEAKSDYGKGREVQARAVRNGTTTSLGKLQRVLEDQGVDLADLGSVKALWHKTKVNEEGAEVYAGSSVLLSPAWEEGPKWTPVDRGPAVKVTVPKAKAVTGGRWKTALILPDQQYGYRRTTSGALDPFHDPRAIDVALQIAEAERPDLTIMLGDVLDLASMSTKFRRGPELSMTTQPAIDRATEDIAKFRALTGEMRFLQGNHDLRLQTYLIDNAEAAYGIKRGGAKADDWPVMSVPYLLRLEEQGVRYIGAYPNGATYINDNLAAIHGKSTDLSVVAGRERVSIIQGHSHHLGVVATTRNSKGAPKFSVAMSPGCLCRIDGAVPGTTASLPDERSGLPVRSWQNWQQGVLVVRYVEGDGMFSWEMVPIFEGWAMHRGQEFRSDLGVSEG